MCMTPLEPDDLIPLAGAVDAMSLFCYEKGVIDCLFILFAVVMLRCSLGCCATDHLQRKKENYAVFSSMNQKRRDVAVKTKQAGSVATAQKSDQEMLARFIPDNNYKLDRVCELYYIMLL